MSVRVPPMPLEQFQASNQAFLGDGGPWLGTIQQGDRPSETVCQAQNWPWCNNGYCLVSAVFPSETRTSYPTSFTANISVSLDHYGGATNLDFTWNYWPLYCGSAIGTGTNVPMHVQVGSAGFDDGLVTVDFTRFFAGAYPWDPAPQISHSGTTSVTRGSDGIGYIPIVISMDMKPTGNNEYLNLYIKGISFQITTAVRDVTPNSPSAGTSSNPSSSSPSASGSVSSTSSGASTSLPSNSSLIPLGTFSPGVLQTGPEGSIPTSEPSIENTQPTPKVNAAAVGAAVGSVAFVALLFVLFFFWRTRKRQAELLEKTELQPVAFSDKPTFEISHSSDAYFSSPNNTHTPYQSDSRPSSGIQMSMGPMSTISPSTYYDPPPTYGSDRVARYPNASPALIEFATVNRVWITEDLEERLAAAGYLPTDDPDNLTEEEWWDKHGITKLELLRLRTIYASNMQSPLDAGVSNEAPVSSNSAFVKGRR